RRWRGGRGDLSQCGFKAGFKKAARDFGACRLRRSVMTSPYVPGPWSLLFRSLLFRYRFKGHGMREERGRSRLLILNSHADSREGSGSAQSAVLKEKDGNFVMICRRLQDHGAKPAQRAHEFGGQGVHGLNALHLRVQRRGGFERQIRRILIAL